MIQYSNVKSLFDNCYIKSSDVVVVQQQQQQPSVITDVSHPVVDHYYTLSLIMVNICLLCGIECLLCTLLALIIAWSVRQTSY